MPAPTVEKLQATLETERAAHLQEVANDEHEIEALAQDLDWMRRRLRILELKLAIERVHCRMGEADYYDFDDGELEELEDREVRAVAALDAMVLTQDEEDL